MSVMKKILISLSLLIITSSAVGAVKVNKEWVNDEVKGSKQYGHIAVYAAAAVSMRRQGIEAGIARYLREQGIDAFPSYILPNLSGNKLVLEEVFTSLSNEEVDAVLSIYVVSVGGGAESEKYVRPNWGMDMSSGWAHPFVDVYTISSGSYTYASKTQQFVLETRLVDFASREPVWLMFTTTKDPEFRNTNKEFIELLSKKLKQTNMLIIK